MSVFRIVATLNFVFAMSYPAYTHGEDDVVSKKPTAELLSTATSDIEAGRGLFRSLCAACHGIDAKGGRAPDLTAVKLRHGDTADALHTNIRQGIAGTGMRGFRLPPKMISQIISYLRQRPSPIDVSDLPGNPEKGQMLFEKHQCFICHGEQGINGRRGPDLTRSRATLKHVRESILNPNQDVSQDYRLVRMLDHNGGVQSGMLMNENGYFLQFMDDAEQLRTVPKTDLEQLHRPETSMMPSYSEVLGEEELLDLTNYVISIRKR